MSAHDTEWHRKVQGLAVGFAASMSHNFDATVQAMAKSYPLVVTDDAKDFVLSVMVDALLSGTTHVIARYAGPELSTEERAVAQVKEKFKAIRTELVRARLTAGAEVVSPKAPTPLRPPSNHGGEK